MYKDIKDFPGYQIGEDGSLRSRWGSGCRGIMGPWRQLKANPASGGYIQYTLYKEGRRYVRLAHTLVLEAFVGPRPPRLKAVHIDKDPANNRLHNLCWGTPYGVARGEEHWAARLKASDIPDIFDLRDSMSIRAISRKYGVSASVISCILHRKLWKHVKL